MAYRWSVVGTILIAQTLVTCVFAFCMTYIGKLAALSALFGGLICVIPNIYLARKLMTKRSPDDSAIKNNIYAAEFGKIVITFALFAGVFATQKWIHPVILLAGFAIAQLTHWLTPLVMSVINKNRE